VQSYDRCGLGLLDGIRRRKGAEIKKTYCEIPGYEIAGA
jgi:hypothetical protein